MNNPAILQTVSEFKILDRNADKFLRFHRTTWGEGWRVEATDRRGNLINAKPITATYVANILERFAADAEITRFSRWNPGESVPRPFL